MTLLQPVSTLFSWVPEEGSYLGGCWGGADEEGLNNCPTAVIRLNRETRTHASKGCTVASLKHGTVGYTKKGRVSTRVRVRERERDRRRRRRHTRDAQPRLEAGAATPLTHSLLTISSIVADYRLSFVTVGVDVHRGWVCTINTGYSVRRPDNVDTKREKMCANN